MGPLAWVWSVRGLIGTRMLEKKDTIKMHHFVPIVGHQKTLLTWSTKACLSGQNFGLWFYLQWNWSHFLYMTWMKKTIAFSKIFTNKCKFCSVLPPWVFLLHTVLQKGRWEVYTYALHKHLYTVNIHQTVNRVRPFGNIMWTGTSPNLFSNQCIVFFF